MAMYVATIRRVVVDAASPEEAAVELYREVKRGAGDRWDPLTVEVSQVSFLVSEGVKMSQVGKYEVGRHEDGEVHAAKKDGD